MPSHPDGQPTAGRRLVPSLITQSLADRQLTGTFFAAGLYLDLSGFTSLTESLIDQGTDGVESLTVTVESLFAPLIDSTFAYGGFVAGYVGDAFLALFPRMTGEDDRSVARRALAAAQAMQVAMRLGGDRHLSQGDFSLQAKIGLGLGPLEWGITTAAESERAVYFFRGSAIRQSALAENEALPGDVVVSAAFQAAVAPHIASSLHRGHHRIDTFPDDLPRPSSTKAQPAAIDPTMLASFVPATIIHQSAKGEFRQILSLFVNVKGDPDAATMRSVMDVVFPLLSKYGGVLYRINFDDKGCNFYIFWGAPASQETDLRRALAFILDLREAAAIPLRAGLTYRNAYAGFIGSPLYEEYTCYSRGVNMAARLMTSAPWGEIWLDETVAGRAGHSHLLEPVGHQHFKGFAEPEAVYRLLAKREVWREPFFRGDFVGREGEIRHLGQAVAALADGEPAGVYILTGEAGLGKSRLIHEFLAQPAVAAAHQVLLCQSDEILHQPFNALSAGLRRYFRQTAQTDDDRRKAAFDATLEELVTATADHELRRELTRTRSFVGHILDLHWPDSLYERAVPQLRSENTEHALKVLFKAMSRQKPLIIHIDDAHSLDRESLAFLPYLLRNIEGFPLSLILTGRQPPPADLFDAATPQRVRHLLPLNQAATARLVNARSAQPPSPEVVTYLASHAEGNPLFVEQLVLLLERGEKGQPRATADGQPALPEMPMDVRSLLIARLDQLPSAVRESVSMAAILGREFGVPTLARMLDDPTHFDGLLESGAIYEVWYPLEEHCYLFRHALLKDVAYDMQLRSRRRVLHARAAGILADESTEEDPAPSRLAEIAYHYDHGDLAAQAADYYGRAADLAAAAYSNEQAVDYYSRALELTNPADLATRFDLLLGREAVYGLLGHRDGQHADLTALISALVALPEPHRQIDVLLRRSALALGVAEYDQAITFAQEAADVASAVNDAVGEGRAYHRLGRVLWQQGLAMEAEPYLQQALALVRRVDNRIEEAECLHDLGVVWHYLGNSAVARDYSLQARAVFDAEGHEQGIIRCLNLLGIINYALGQFEAAEMAYADGLTRVQSLGWRFAKSTFLHNFSNLLFELGDYKHAQEMQQEALTIARDTANLETQSVSLDTLGLIAFCQGDTPAAFTLFEQGLAVAREIANERSLGYLLTHRGLVQAEDGAAVAAVETLREALTIRERLGNPAAHMDTLSILAMAHARAGQMDEAMTALTPVLDWVGANGIEGIELPVKLYTIAYEVLSKANAGTAESPNRRAYLQSGYDLIQGRLNALDTTERRERFLQGVPFNRDLLALWHAQATSDPDI